MISQLLRPDFLQDRGIELAEALEWHAAQLDRADANVLAEARKAGVTAEDLRAAKLTLESLGSEEFSRSDTEAAWLPRDAHVSILQSGLEEFYHTVHAVVDSAPPGLTGTGVPDVTGESLKPEWIPTPSHGLVRQMETGDLAGWSLSFAVAKTIKLRKGLHDFREVKHKPFSLDGPVRLVMCADWASGLPRAQKVARKMSARIDGLGGAERNVQVVDLGDTYYAGRDFEYRAHRSDYWPVTETQAEKVGSWCLNGNHDMFPGGHHYFQFLDEDKRFSRQKGCSYFALETSHWLILGLDSAYEAEGASGDGGGLMSPQLQWLKELRASRPNKRLMLLSHHQLFSGYEHDSPLLMNRLEPLLNSGKPIDAWFWGHEHRCAVYHPTPAVHFPVLMGHGGVPVFAQNRPKPESVWFEYKGVRPGGILKKHAMLGFVVVDLDEDRATVEFVNEEGMPHDRFASKGYGDWKKI